MAYNVSRKLNKSKWSEMYVNKNCKLSFQVFRSLMLSLKLNASYKNTRGYKIFMKHSFLLVGQSNMAGRGFLKEVPIICNEHINVMRNGRWQIMMQPINRSEEHTSELQSRGHLVCRLLLEKKKEVKSKETASKKNREHNTEIGS